MLRVKADDFDAFDRLITRYRNSVVNTLHRITRKHDGSEDLAQEVFLRVFRSRKTYQAKAKFTTWLFCIVRNVAYNAVRDRNRHKEVSTFTNGYEKGHGEAVFKSEQPDPEEIARVSELKRDLEKAMARLSLNQRTALVLSRLEGMAYIEIAKILDTSEAAVKMLVRRARKILARELDHYIQGT